MVTFPTGALPGRTPVPSEPTRLWFDWKPGTLAGSACHTRAPRPRALMSSLLAVVSDDRRRPVPREAMDQLVQVAQDLRGPSEVRHASVGEWARVACVGKPDLEWRSDDGMGWLMALGAVHLTSASPRLAAEDLDGQFAAALYVHEREELEVFNDPLGMQGLYRAEHGGRTYIATSCTVLARHLSASPDVLGARLFLHTGNQFGPVTHWQGIERLEPATVLTFAAHGSGRRSSWRPTVDRRVRAMGFQQTVDHCAEVVVETVRRRLDDLNPLSADLTGGYDSRLVAAILKAGDLSFETVTSGEEESVDVRLAREVAAAAGLQWRQQRLPAGWRLGPELLDEAIVWADGTLQALQLGEVLWRQGERSASCSALIAGGGGEHFGPYPWLQEFAHAGRSRRVNFDRLMTMRVLTPMDLSMVRGGFGGDVEEYSRGTLARRVEPYTDELNTTQLDLIYAYKTTGHFGAYRAASAAHVRQELPCYYRDVFTAAFSANHRWRNAHRLHRALVERLAPEMAVIETERGGPAQLVRPANAHRFAPYYLRLGRTAARKILGRQSAAGELSSEARGGFVGAIGQLRAEGVLTPGQMRSGALYEPKALDAFVERSQATGFDGWPLLGRIATIELLLRKVDDAAF